MRTAQALNLSLSTVRQVLSAINKNGGIVRRTERKAGGHGVPKIGEHEIAVVRRMIRDAYLRGEPVTIRKLLRRPDEREIPATHSSLRRALPRNGFFFGNVCRRSALRERDDVTANRRKYLADLRSDRDRNGFTVRPEVYPDETFVTFPAILRSYLTMLLTTMLLQKKPFRNSQAKKLIFGSGLKKTEFLSTTGFSDLPYTIFAAKMRPLRNIRLTNLQLNMAATY